MADSVTMRGWPSSQRQIGANNAVNLTGKEAGKATIIGQPNKRRLGQVTHIQSSAAKSGFLSWKRRSPEWTRLFSGEAIVWCFPALLLAALILFAADARAQEELTDQQQAWIAAMNSPEFSRHPRFSFRAAVRTRRATASRFSHACASDCRTSRCSRTHPAVPRPGSCMSCAVSAPA